MILFLNRNQCRFQPMAQACGGPIVVRRLQYPRIEPSSRLDEGKVCLPNSWAINWTRHCLLRTTITSIAA